MKSRFLKTAIPVVIVAGLVLTSFQNCGQPGTISTIEPENKQNFQGEPGLPQFASKGLSTSEPPPLKLIFVMDNSNSMTLNNLNLKQSISAMFDGQADNISNFNSEIFFLSTAQSPTLASGFLSRLKAPSEVGISQLSQVANYRGEDWVSGVIAGDILGFRRSLSTGDDFSAVEYLPQPVVDFQSNSQGIAISPSVVYTQGSSVSDLILRAGNRLDVLKPEKASNSLESSLFSALDKESGLCAMARVLRSPSGIIQPGDLASFVIISDENETNPSGSDCLFSDRNDALYTATCSTPMPEVRKNLLSFSYQVPAGSPFVRTTFEVVNFDSVRKKRVSTLKLVRNAVNSVCNGELEKDFAVNYVVTNPNFQINYTKWAKVGDREGGVVVYSNTSTTGSKVLVGDIPSDCMTNLNRLKSALGDSVSKFRIDSCSQAATSDSSFSAVYDFASYPSAVVPSSSCSTAIQSAVMSGKSGTLKTCVLAKRVSSIPSSWITDKGFPSDGTDTQCKAAIDSVCSGSNGNYRSCTFKSFTANVTPLTYGPVSVTDTVDYGCSATCDKFPGLCSTNSAIKVSDFASSLSLTCTATNVDHASETYNVAQSPRSVVLDAGAALSCSSTCAQATSGAITACSAGSSGTSLVSAATKSCVVKSAVTMQGSAAMNKTTNNVEDANLSLGCQSFCSQLGSLCNLISGAALSTTRMQDYIINKLGGTGCSINRSVQVIPATTKTSTVANLLKDQVTSSCPSGSNYTSSVRTSAVRNTKKTVSESQNLSDYVVTKLRDVVGEQGSSMSAFITPISGGSTATATTYGETYKTVVERISRGTVNDIKASSYVDALRNLSSILKDQLTRSVTFAEVRPGQRVYRVWKKSRSTTDWGQPLQNTLWSASGGTVTLDGSLQLDLNDEIKIEFY